ncbi:hypothetical protein ACUUL3_09345 [Thiovibrio sp. JS02]
MHVICCVCQKTKNRNHWVSKATPAGAKLSHGYCPRCYRQLLERMNDFSARQEYRKSA